MNKADRVCSEPHDKIDSAISPEYIIRWNLGDFDSVHSGQHHMGHSRAVTLLAIIC